MLTSVDAGGFGSESSSVSDAFCQTVKELVENAVDACCQSSSSNVHQRVKTEINEQDQNTLQVIVTDNLSGMVDIQECVNAFKSTKGKDETVGRYGVGLTLCVLHAQRLVPNSYACITLSLWMERDTDEVARHSPWLVRTNNTVTKAKNRILS